MSLVFATSETSEKRLIIQSINIVMKNKSAPNTQENVVKYSLIEFSVFHDTAVAIFYKINKSPLNERNSILDRTYFRTLYI